MLEKTVSGFKKYLPLFLLAGMSLYQGCSTPGNSVNTANPDPFSYGGQGFEKYETISIDSMPESKQTNEENQNRYDSTDYAKMGWKETIKNVKTPEQAQRYLNNYFNYGEVNVANNGFFEPFNKNHKDGVGTCIDHAAASAAILKDNGYLPIIMDLKSSEGLRHTEHIYRIDDKYYTIGTKGISEGYSSTRELAKQFNEVQDKYTFTEFSLFDLNQNHGDEWIKNLYKVENRVAPSDTANIYKIPQD